MLSRRNRFHGYNAVSRAYKNSYTIRSSYLNLKFAKRSDSKPYRVAIVVSKKVHKSAVARNRIRRRIYEIVRMSEHVPKSADLVFTVFDSKLEEMPTSELSELINKLLIKADTSA